MKNLTLTSFTRMMHVKRSSLFLRRIFLLFPLLYLTHGVHAQTCTPAPIVQTGNIRHTICAAGGGTLTAQFFAGQSYQWQVSTDVGNSWSNIIDGGSYSGAASDVLFISNAASLDGTLYRYIATASGGCKDTSGIDTLHVLQPVINTQPVAATVCVGNSATYTVAASSPVDLTYQWQLGTTNINNNGTYSNVNGTTLTISNVTAAMDRQLYRVAIRDTLTCLTNSNQVRLFVIAPPVINTQPQNVATCANTNASFTVAATSATASGTAARTYQWQTDNGSNGSTWTNISSGGTTATLTLTSVTIAMNGYRYRVTVSTSPSCGSVVSSEATLSVRSSGTWLGAIDTNWHVAGNWCGGVPVSTTDVLIPNWAPRMPTISNNTGIAYSRNLVIENNAKLTISGGSTSMTGPFNILGTVAYTAPVDQPVLPADHGSLEINGGGNKFLQINTGVSHNMVLGGSAKLVTGNNLLTMKNGSNPISGASFTGPVNSWIVTGNGNSGSLNTGTGGLRFEQVNAGKGTILFPVGPTSSAYNPALLSNNGSVDDITMAVNDQLIPGALINSSINRTWLISEAVNGGSLISLELAWSGGEEGSMFRRGQSQVVRSNGTSIVEQSNIDSAAGLNPYSRLQGSYNVLSQFSVISTINGIVLPVELKSFSAAKLSDRSVMVQWETGSDHSSASQFIQRASDGLNFITIGSVNSIEGKTIYSFTDDQFDKVAWYRLKIVTIEGKVVYSRVVKVAAQESKQKLELRPSVTQNGSITLFAEMPYAVSSTIRLLDYSGRQIAITIQQLQKGQNYFPVRTNHLSPGIYYVQVDVKHQRMHVLRFIKQ